MFSKKIKLDKLVFTKPTIINKFSQPQCQKLWFSSNVSENSTKNIKRTSLYDFHLKHGAKMIPFAGYEMPLQYSDFSIRDSHLHTRSQVSLFDVSHMLQIEINGNDSISFFESLVVADVDSLPINGALLTLYTNDNGGIVDDLIVSKTAVNSLYIVSNASRIDADIMNLKEKENTFRKNYPNSDLSWKILSNQSLLALQGPFAEKALQKFVNFDLKSIKFMNGIDTLIENTNVRLTRCGYTGEDGFEIKIPSEKAPEITEKILSTSTANIKLAGLGARDSLRLEAGLCLYGNDINAETSPIEASLAWTIAKKRRVKADFPGASIILKQLKDKPKKRRVGLLATKSGPTARADSIIYNFEKKNVGKVTSGCPSPTLSQNIAMAYVDRDWAKVDNNLWCEVRGKLYEYRVVKMPFVPSRYYI